MWSVVIVRRPKAGGALENREFRCDVCTGCSCARPGPTMTAVSLSPEWLIATFGTIGILAIVFVESGLLVGFFLPGDSLLFTAGLLASQGQLNIAVIVVGSVIAAIAGDQLGFAIGRRFGPRLLARERWFTRRHHVERAERFFVERGGRAILLARFVPIVRTFVPVIAGVVGMRYRSFVVWNVAGGVCWAAGISLAGYVLGETVPGIDRYLLPVIGFIVVASIVPVVRELRTSQPGAEPLAEPAVSTSEV